jgi:hypothetical protein
VATQQRHNVHLFGALLTGIAYQPFNYKVVALQIAQVGQVRMARIPPVPRLRLTRVIRPVRSGKAA